MLTSWTLNCAELFLFFAFFPCLLYIKTFSMTLQLNMEYELRVETWRMLSVECDVCLEFSI